MDANRGVAWGSERLLVKRSDSVKEAEDICRIEQCQAEVHVKLVRMLRCATGGQGP